jgi:hypothetical protein
MVKLGIEKTKERKTMKTYIVFNRSTGEKFYRDNKDDAVRHHSYLSNKGYNVSILVENRKTGEFKRVKA